MMEHLESLTQRFHLHRVDIRTSCCPAVGSDDGLHLLTKSSPAPKPALVTLGEDHTEIRGSHKTDKVTRLVLFFV